MTGAGPEALGPREGRTTQTSRSPRPSSEAGAVERRERMLRMTENPKGTSEKASGYAPSGAVSHLAHWFRFESASL